jgi:hypothetical protein
MPRAIEFQVDEYKGNRRGVAEMVSIISGRRRRSVMAN